MLSELEDGCIKIGMLGWWIFYFFYSFCIYILLFISNMVYVVIYFKDVFKNFDFIVFGGGVGGCIVVGCFVENLNVFVFFVEVGVKWVFFFVLVLVFRFIVISNFFEIIDIIILVKVMGLWNF